MRFSNKIVESISDVFHNSLLPHFIDECINRVIEDLTTELSKYYESNDQISNVQLNILLAYETVPIFPIVIQGLGKVTLLILVRYSSKVVIRIRFSHKLPRIVVIRTTERLP